MRTSDGISKKDDSMILLLTNTLMWSVMAMHTPFMTSFYAVKGLSTFEIGVLIAMTPILTILIQPFWAYFSDRTGKRKAVLILIALASGLVIQGYQLCSTFLMFMVEAILFGMFATAVLPLNDAVVSNHGKKSRLGFARIRMGGTIGYAVVALILGNVIKSNVNLIFPISGIGYLLLALCYLRLPGDEPKKAIQKSAKGRIFKDNKVVFIFLLAFLVQVGLSINGFYGVYVIELGYSQAIVGLSSCISALSELPILFFADKILKRFKIEHLMIFSIFMGALRLFSAGSGMLPLMIGGQLLQSVTYMIPYYCCIVFINENVVDGKISQGQSILVMVQQGFAMVAGSLLGGAISNEIGLKSTFAVVAVAMAVAGVAAIFIGKRMFLGEKGKD